MINIFGKMKSRKNQVNKFKGRAVWIMIVSGTNTLVSSDDKGATAELLTRNLIHERFAERENGKWSPGLESAMNYKTLGYELRHDSLSRGWLEVLGLFCSGFPCQAQQFDRCQVGNPEQILSKN